MPMKPKNRTAGLLLVIQQRNEKRAYRIFKIKLQQ